MTRTYEVTSKRMIGPNGTQKKKKYRAESAQWLHLGPPEEQPDTSECI